MIRQDYLLRMIEQLRRVLPGIVALKKERRWQEITGALDEQFTQLVGAGAADAARLSDTALMARLVQGESTQGARPRRNTYENEIRCQVSRLHVFHSDLLRQCHG